MTMKVSVGQLGQLLMYFKEQKGFLKYSGRTALL
jgi:hypothetical protein